MKKYTLFLTFICFTLVASLSLSTLVMAESSVAIKDNYILDSFNNTNNVSVEGDMLTIEHDANINETGTNDGSLKISQPHISATASTEYTATIALQGDYYSSAVLDLSKYTGIRFFIKYDGTKQLKLRPKFNIRDQARGGANKSYIEVNEVKKTRSEKKFSSDGNGYLYIDPGFSGYIYIPFASLQSWGSSGVDTTKAHSLLLNVFSTTLGENNMWIDGIGAYRLSDVQIYDFETESLKSANSNFNNSIYTVDASATIKTKVTDEEHSPLSRKSLKIYGGTAKSDNDIITFNRWYSSSLQLNLANYAGISFWINNCNDKDIDFGFYIAYEANVADGKLTLVSEDGTVTEKTFTGNKNRYFVLPANFKGYVYVPKASLGKTSTFGHDLAVRVVDATIENPLYIDEIKMYNEIPSNEQTAYETSVLNFEQLPSKRVVVSDKASKTTVSNGILKVESKVSDNVDCIIKVAVSQDVSGYTGLRMRLITTSALQLKPSWGNGAAIENKTYRLGNTALNINSNGAIEIPKNFDGYITLPFDIFANGKSGASLSFKYSSLDSFQIDVLAGVRDVAGDANGDEEVDIRDLVRTKLYIDSEGNEDVYYMADITNDNNIDDLDLVGIRMLLLK